MQSTIATPERIREAPNGFKPLPDTASNGAGRTPLLQVRELRVRYGDQLACEALNFTTYPGERVAIIGPNGAGKSSLFKAIVGLLPVYSGSISIAGQNGTRRQNWISYVPQHEQVDWNFPANVWDVVMMARTRHIGYFWLAGRRDRQAVRHALEQVEMWELRHRQIGQLSGGQRRRVFIARALAQEAKVLLMDEPFAGVDATTEADLFHVLDKLRGSDVTVLIATHNLGQAATHYDKVLMMNRQQIAFGVPQEIYTMQNLSQTFGGYLTFWEDNREKVLISDDPCHHHDCD